MLGRARQAVATHPRRAAVTFRHGTERSLRPGERFDVAITFFVLDTLRPVALRRAVRTLTACLPAHGHWLFADFVRPSHRLLRPNERALLALMYTFFRCVGAVDHGRLPRYPLAAAGWHAVRSHRDGLIGGQLLLRADAAPGPPA